MRSFLKQADQSQKKEEKKGVKKDDKKGASVGKSRSFLQSWKINRDWLKYEGGVMFCSTCRAEQGDISKACGSKVYVKVSVRL